MTAPVSPRAREAAANYWRSMGLHFVENVLNGTEDDMPTVQAFAQFEQAIVGDGERMANAARAVLAHRVGDLPSKGWLRDNDASRQALHDLSVALPPLPPVEARDGE